jgi:hypothetical protein
MGRGKRAARTNGTKTPSVIAERERLVREQLPKGGGTANYVRIDGVTSRQVNASLQKLEKQGLVERYPNGNGPETPWWWTRLPLAPDEFGPSTVTIARGDIYDRSGTDLVFIELTGKLNEHGCAIASLKAGDNNARQVFVPLHLLDREGFWYKRRRGPVTDYSSRFSCPTHGECTDDMVTTKKTCALCGQILNRH